MLGGGRGVKHAALTSGRGATEILVWIGGKRGSTNQKHCIIVIVINVSSSACLSVLVGSGWCFYSFRIPCMQECGGRSVKLGNTRNEMVHARVAPAPFLKEARRGAGGGEVGRQKGS